MAEAQPARAGHVILAIVLGAIEANTGKHTWRQPSKTASAYFAQIAAWGYPLSEVEQIVIGVEEVHAAPEAEGAVESTDANYSSRFDGNTAV